MIVDGYSTFREYAHTEKHCLWYIHLSYSICNACMNNIFSSPPAPEDVSFAASHFLFTLTYTFVQV